MKAPKGWKVVTEPTIQVGGSIWQEKTFLQRGKWRIEKQPVGGVVHWNLTGTGIARIFARLKDATAFVFHIETEEENPLR